MFSRLRLAACFALFATIGTGCNSSPGPAAEAAFIPCDTEWESDDFFAGFMGDLCGRNECEADVVNVAEGEQFDFDWFTEFRNEGGVSPGLEIEVLSSDPDVIALSEVKTSVSGIDSFSNDDDPSCEAGRSIYGGGHVDARSAGTASLQLIEGNEVMDTFQIVVSEIDAFHFAWRANGTSGDTASSATLTVPRGKITYVTPLALSSTGQELKLGNVKWTLEPADVFELRQGYYHYEDKGVELHVEKNGTAVLRAEVGSASHELTVTVGP